MVATSLSQQMLRNRVPATRRRAFGFYVAAVMALATALTLDDFLVLPEALADLTTTMELGLCIMAVLAVFYRYGPSRDEPRWRWVSWGAVLAAVLWILGSIAFSIYVRNFGSYNETYGSLGAVVILLMWFWLSGFIVLLGAELNAEMEHQTAQDTTKGPSVPQGQRGARMADTVGEKRAS